MVCLLMVLPAPAEHHAVSRRFPVEQSVLIQQYGSRQDGGKLLGVRVVGAAAAPCRLPFNFIIVGFGIFFNPAPLEQAHNSLQIPDTFSGAACVLYILTTEIASSSRAYLPF